jgi:hypothetical protein
LSQTQAFVSDGWGSSFNDSFTDRFARENPYSSYTNLPVHSWFS